MKNFLVLEQNFQSEKILTFILIFSRNCNNSVLNVFILVHFRLIFSLIEIGWIIILVTNSNSNVLGNCREKRSENHERSHERVTKEVTKESQKKSRKESEEKKRKFGKVSKVSRLLELRTKVSTGTR